MPRAQKGQARVRRARRKRVLSQTSGYRGARSRRFRVANEQLIHSLRYAYRDRRDRKGQFRRLWITRISAASRNNGITYSRLMNGLKKAEVDIDRKVLADIAVRDPAAFTTLADLAKQQLANG